MNILVVGSGKGSWAMRGLQLGAALGARVTSQPSDADWRWAEQVVLVKRAGLQHAATAHRYGVPIVWDALDFWRQPHDNRLWEADAIRTLRSMVAQIEPTLTIGATQAMADACDGVYLPHHAWSLLRPTEARDTVRTVAYEGGPVYLGRWQRALEAECGRRGWRFVVNPPDLSQADLLVAFRDGPWDGWICREWKSGVKVVNALAAGRPLISQASAAVRELEPAGSVIESPDELSEALDRWTSHEARTRAVERGRAVCWRYGLAAVASRYRAVLEGTGEPCGTA